MAGLRKPGHYYVPRPHFPMKPRGRRSVNNHIREQFPFSMN